MAQNANNSTLMKPIPRGWKQVGSFSSVQNCRLDFKQALVEMIIGFGESFRYFEQVETRTQQVKTLNLLMRKIGNKTGWRQEFIAQEHKRKKTQAALHISTVHSYSSFGHSSPVETAWDQKIHNLKQKFQEIEKSYHLAKQENQELGFQITAPVLTTMFRQLVKEAELAKYILLFEPNFPEDMPDIPLPYKRVKYGQDITEGIVVGAWEDLADFGISLDWTKEIPALSEFVFPGEPFYDSSSILTGTAPASPVPKSKWLDATKIKDWRDEEDKKQAIYDLAVYRGYEDRYAITEAGKRAEDFYISNMVNLRAQMRQLVEQHPRLIEVVDQFYDHVALAEKHKSQESLRELCVPAVGVTEEFPCDLAYEVFWHSYLDPEFWAKLQAESQKNSPVPSQAALSTDASSSSSSQLEKEEEAILEILDAAQKERGSKEISVWDPILLGRLNDLCKEIFGDYDHRPIRFSPFKVKADKFKSFWFMKEWREYKNAHRRTKALAQVEHQTMIERTAIIVPEGRTKEELIYAMYSSDITDDDKIREIAYKTKAYPQQKHEKFKERRNLACDAFAERLLKYAKAAGLETDEFAERLQHPYRKTFEIDGIKASVEPLSPAEAEKVLKEMAGKLPVATSLPIRLHNLTTKGFSQESQEVQQELLAEWAFHESYFIGKALRGESHSYELMAPEEQVQSLLSLKEQAAQQKRRWNQGEVKYQGLDANLVNAWRQSIVEEFSNDLKRGGVSSLRDIFKDPPRGHFWLKSLVFDDFILNPSDFIGVSVSSAGDNLEQTIQVQPVQQDQLAETSQSKEADGEKFQNSQVICYNPDTLMVTYNDKAVFKAKVKRERYMFLALVGGTGIHRDNMKKFIWPKKPAPENWIREVHNTASALRAAFNDLETGLGDRLLPDAVDSVYRLNRESFSFLKVDT